MRDELERVEIHGEDDARERTWNVVHEAFTEREPVPRPSHWPRVAAVALALAALGAAAFSSPGQAVLDEIREVVGVERAQPALFSVPASGRLLVASDAGVWVVNQDGSKRLLGSYREASWSPFGRFVVVAREHELAALETDGEVRWTIARRAVRWPRWAGTETNTRIAYLTSGTLHVIAGDGRDDTDLRGLRATVRLAPAWRPGAGFVLGFVDGRGRVHSFDLETGRTAWPQRPVLSGRFPDARKVVWSSDGRRLVLMRRSMILAFGTKNASPLGLRQLRDVRDIEFRPGTHQLAVARGTEVLLVDGDRPGRPARRLFSGAGTFDRVVWSPDGRWLLISWPAADQWIFVRADGKRVRAVANVSQQFRSRTFPRVEGWCCAR